MMVNYDTNVTNAFNSFILRLYKAIYVVFVSRLIKCSKKKHLCFL